MDKEYKSFLQMVRRISKQRKEESFIEKINRIDNTNIFFRKELKEEKNRRNEKK